MIYVFLNNIFLELAVKKILHPMRCEILLPDHAGLRTLESCKESDVIVTNTSTTSSVTKKWNSGVTMSKIIFLSEKHSEHIIFRTPGINLIILSCALSEDVFRLALVNAVKNKKITHYEHITRFTTKEDTVFWSSLKGIPVPEIASEQMSSRSTIYACRLRACRKLGVRKIVESIPFLTCFKEFREKMHEGLTVTL